MKEERIRGTRVEKWTVDVSIALFCSYGRGVGGSGDESGEGECSGMLNPTCSCVVGAVARPSG